MSAEFDIQPEAFAFEAEPGEFEAWQAEASGAWQQEQNRGSADYIRWVQSALNQILGLNLAVDGRVGPQTRSAVRSFQQKQGLVVDGIVGPATEAALRATLARLTPGSAAVGKSCQGLRSPEILDNFVFDRDQVRPHHQPLIQRIAQCIVASQSTAQPIRQLRLVGHTDKVGTDAYNLDLGRRRAEQVRRALQVALDRLSVRLSNKINMIVDTRGESQSISPDAARNRRVEIFLPQGPCFAPSVTKNDPTALNVSPVGSLDYSGGRVQLFGRTLTVNGTVFYPAQSAGRGTPFNTRIAQEGPVPIVFITHGNHAIFHDPRNRSNETCSNPGGFRVIQNHKGYEYFQSQLARMGIIAVSVNCNETNCDSLTANNIQQRSGLILQSIRHFQSLNASRSSIFRGRIDFSKVGLLGHSRGGEAVLVVPETLALGSSGISGVNIKGVISLAPTDINASSGQPKGYAFMVILPAGDGDVAKNDGAKFYDQAAVDPFKVQLYVHNTNHNFFNREWPDDDGHGPTVISRANHERILSAYGCAFFRQALLGHSFLKLLTGEEIPPNTATNNVHLSFELTGATTVDDHENRNISLNTLGQPTTQSAGMTAAEFDFAQVSSGSFNTTFFGKTVGMVAQSSSPSGLFRSLLPQETDFTGREIWVRAAEVYDGLAVPASATGYKIGLEDSSGTVAFVDSNEVGGLPRPYNRRTDDLATFGRDLTKTMLKTLRFPANCFSRSTSNLNLKRIKAVLLRLDRGDKRALAFDQLQIFA